MNAIMYAINEVSNQIPHELLHAGLTIDETPETINMTSLDDKILRKILKKRILLDANIIGGIETIIPLNNIQPSYTEYFYTIYNIPPELTMNKEIISVLGISYMPGNGFLGGTGGYNSNPTSMIDGGQFNAITNVANRIGNAASMNGILNNAHIEIVSYNTILVYANYRTIANYGLRVLLENDSNLNNIQPRSYKNFSFLVVLGVKAYLYNKLIIPINSGYLASGQDLGMFKSILESYSDAEEQYRTYLREVWAPTAYMNDVIRYNRYLSSMISPNI